MNSFTRIGRTLFAATALACVLPAAASAASISGKVTGQSGMGLSGVCVEANNSDFSASGSAQTVSGGTYTITGLPAGSFKVRFSDCAQQNVLPEYWNDKKTVESATPVTLGATTNAQNISPVLATGGRITGLLTNVAGQPLEGICVEATGSGDNYGDTRTNASGVYEIKGLATDSYILFFSGCGNSFVLDEWYDDAFALEFADPVPVTAGSLTSGRNATITTGGSIEGNVKDMAGAPVQNACVEAKSTTNVVGTAKTDASGNYSIKMLRAGSYVVRFYDCAGAGVVQEYFRDQTNKNLAEKITVTTGSETIGVDAQVVKLGSITGKVTSPSGTALKDVCVDARQDEDTSKGAAVSAADGTYKISNLVTGSYKVEFSDCADIGVAGEYYNDKPDFASANAVSVTTGSNTPNVNASLSTGGSISGVVTRTGGTPLAGICVDAYGASGGAGGYAETNATGTYTVSRLAAGSYKLQFTDCGSTNGVLSEYYNDKTSLATANTVSVTDGVTTGSINATLEAPVVPDTVVDTGPASAIATSQATLTFHGTPANATSKIQCRLDTGTYSDCESPLTLSGLSDGSHTVYVRAQNSAGGADQTPAERSFTVDTTAPDTSIATGPSGKTTATSAAFTYAATESGSTFECRLSTGTWESCQTAGKSYSALADGSRTFEVRAKDSLGNTDATPATRSWEVDTTAPDTSVATGPSGRTTQTSAAFTYTATESGSTFECRLSAGTWESCPTAGKSYAALADGSRTFEVRAKDSLGNTDPTPATRNWEIDTTAPDTSIATGPSGRTTQTSAAFTYAATESGSTFECRLSTGTWESCQTAGKSYSALTDGSRTFEVRAKDSLGNTDATPATRSWEVDTTAPDTSIATGPSGKTTQTSAAFTYAATESGSTFECRLSTGTWESCQAAGKDYSALTDGSRTFEVRAMDSLGNTDATPATRSWEVDTTSPDTLIESGPSATTTDTSASFTYSAQGSSAGFECRLDSGQFAMCPANGKSYAGLAPGTHQFEVRALDDLGNRDATPATRSWTVEEITTPPDTTAPDTDIATGPTGTTTASTADFTYTSTEPGSTFECRLDSAQFASCPTSGKGYSGLTPGSHTFEVRSTDAAGNVDQIPAERTWTVEEPGPSQECLDAMADEDEAESAAAAAASAVTKAKAGLKKAKKSKKKNKIKKAKAKLKKATAADKAAQSELTTARAFTASMCD